MNNNRRLYRHLVAPLSMQVEVTSRCNCKCQHCYNYWRGDETLNIANEHMTMEVAERVLAECVENKLFNVVITGGEPFLNFPVAKWLTENLKKNGINVSINTNLSLVTEEWVEWLIANKIGVLTSVLGPNSDVHDNITTVKGSFDKTIRGVELMVEHGARLSVNIVASQLNHCYLEPTLEMLFQKGVKSMSITPAVQPGYCHDFSALELNNDQIVDCLNLLTRFKQKRGVKVDALTCLPLCALADVEDILYFSRRTCTIGRGQIACGSDGSIRACTHYNVSEGNLMQERLKTIWERFEKWCFADSVPGTCVHCPLLDTCNCGCRVEAEIHTGGIGNMDPKAVPQNVEKVSWRIKELTRPTAAVEIGESFKILPYKSRDEEFGAAVCKPGTLDVVFLTNVAISVLRSFEIEKVYKVSDVMSEYTSDDKKAFLIGLSNHQLLRFTE